VIGLYIHVPFCRTRCPYCDFVRYPVEGDVPGAYIDTVCGEIVRFEGPDVVSTVFFGGGTPSLLNPSALDAILGAVAKRFRLDKPEITIEANPDDVTPDLARAWERCGVNRVSLGVQSFDNDALRYLGRRHDAACSVEACRIVSDHFDNWGMDLIFGAPPLSSWSATLERCVRLCPKHISTYGLTYEKGTPFEAFAEHGVDDDTWLTLYGNAVDALSEMVHYEVSNFAIPGYVCAHNLIYWRNEAYAGFGPGAYSFIDGVRSRNFADIEEYLGRPGEKSEAFRLSDPEIRVETVIQHLRLRAGLPKAEYRRRFGRSLTKDYGPAITQLIARGLVEEDDMAFRPTQKGFELNNEIGLALVDDRPHQ